MSKGQMSADGNYPSANGQPLDGASMLKNFKMRRHRVALTIGGTPGTGASYQLQALVIDDNVNQWVNVNSALLSGTGAAATGQIVTYIIGMAVRLVAANGTTPGTGAATPTYELNVYPGKPEHYSVT